MKISPPPVDPGRALDPLLEKTFFAPDFPDKWFVHGQQTFAQVYATAGAIRDFIEASVPPGRPVCLCAEDRGLVAAALLATADGRTPLILSYANTPRPLADLQRLTGFSSVITDNKRQLPPDVTVFSAPPQDIAPAPSRPSLSVEPAKKWLYLYTGGSTGSPKLWSKTGTNLWSEAIYLCRTYGFGPQDRMVATVAPNHIYGLLYSVMAPLLASSTVIAGLPTFPQEIVSAIDGHEATVLISAPAHYRVLNGHPSFGQSLRAAFSSAGALKPEDGDAFYRQTQTPVTEIYGSTETGGIAGRCRCAGDVGFRPFSPIGWQIEGNRLRVRSPFISAELPTDPKGFFTTPDRVEACAEGFLVQGRADHVVKVGGKRVDMERLREALVGLDGVRDAYVTAVPMASGRENELVAVVEGDREPEAIREDLGRILEPFEMPRSIRTVRRIPTTPAGKYDRKAATALFSPK